MAISNAQILQYFTQINIVRRSDIKRNVCNVELHLHIVDDEVKK